MILEYKFNSQYKYATNNKLNVHTKLTCQNLILIYKGDHSEYTRKCRK